MGTCWIWWRKVPPFTLLSLYHILSETEIWPFVRLLLAWIVQRFNIRCIGILQRGLFRSSNKSELPWMMKRIWSKEWAKLGSNRCVQIGHDNIVSYVFHFWGAIAYRMKYMDLKYTKSFSLWRRQKYHHRSPLIFDQKHTLYH